MTAALVFTLPGEPVAWSRPRFNRASGAVFNSKKLDSFEALVRYTAAQELGGEPPMDGPVCLTISVQLAPAPSWPLKRQAAALTGAIRPTGRPDLSNIAKAIEDGLKTVAYRDDAQVVKLVVEKRYGPADLTVVDVRSVS